MDKCELSDDEIAHHTWSIGDAYAYGSGAQDRLRDALRLQRERIVAILETEAKAWGGGKKTDLLCDLIEKIQADS